MAKNVLFWHIFNVFSGTSQGGPKDCFKSADLRRETCPLSVQESKILSVKQVGPRGASFACSGLYFRVSCWVDDHLGSGLAWGATLT